MEFRPNDICFSSLYYENFLKITTDNAINKLTIDKRWVPS